MHGEAVLFLPAKRTGQDSRVAKAISRKDRDLQQTDYHCEKIFEPHLVSKTCEAKYNGDVLQSAPRGAFLAKDAVRVKFPDCPVYLSKNLKQGKRPAERCGIGVATRRRREEHTLKELKP